MKDTMSNKCLFTQIKEALECGDFEVASKLQLEMNDKMKELQVDIFTTKNIF